MLGALARETADGPARARSSPASRTATRRCSPRRSRRSTCISGGRAILGLGAAWNEEEHIGYGYRLPAGQGADGPPRRGADDRQAMFTEERPSFEGKHYRIDEALNVPRPDPGRRPADPRRRWRRAADAAHRRQVRRHDPLVRARARGPAPQERAAASATARRSAATRRRSSGRSARRSSSCRRGGGQGVPRAACPPERRAHVVAGTPEQVVDALRPYIDAGFTGLHVQQRDLPDAGADRARSASCCRWSGPSLPAEALAPPQIGHIRVASRVDVMTGRC